MENRGVIRPRRRSDIFSSFDETDFSIDGHDAFFYLARGILLIIALIYLGVLINIIFYP